jgi:hypothetical protein
LGTWIFLLEVEEVQKLVFQIAALNNRLKELGVVKREDKIVDDYVEWFCSHKFGLDLCDKDKFGYDAVSKYGEKVQIKTKKGSEIDFKINFDGIRLNKFDYLFVVFINEVTWMIDSIYKISNKVVKQFLSTDQEKKFEWRRESRSLSLQIYPDEDNMIFL